MLLVCCSSLPACGIAGAQINSPADVTEGSVAIAYLARKAKTRLSVDAY